MATDNQNHQPAAKIHHLQKRSHKPAMMMFLGRLVRPIPSAQNSNFFTKRNASSTPDYVVIGAGSAGCVVSSRLAEAGKSVTLLEAGSSDRASPTDLFVHMPTALAWPMSMERYNWSFKVRD